MKCCRTQQQNIRRFFSTFWFQCSAIYLYFWLLNLVGHGDRSEEIAGLCHGHKLQTSLHIQRSRLESVQECASLDGFIAVVGIVKYPDLRELPCNMFVFEKKFGWNVWRLRKEECEDYIWARNTYLVLRVLQLFQSLVFLRIGMLCKKLWILVETLFRLQKEWSMLIVDIISQVRSNEFLEDASFVSLVYV